MSESGEFEMFQRTELKLDAIDSDMLRRGAQDRARLVVEVNLTDKKGNPACATLRPPQIEWSAEDAAT